jgi:hypothetical protein
VPLRSHQQQISGQEIGQRIKLLVNQENEGIWTWIEHLYLSGVWQGSYSRQRWKKCPKDRISTLLTGQKKECKMKVISNTKEAITYKGQQQGSEIIMYYCPYPGSLLGPLDLNNTALHKQGELTYSYR